MITDYILTFFERIFLGVVRFLSMLWPSVPGWMSIATASVSAVMARAHTLGYWVPLEWFVPALSFTVGLWTLAISIRFVITAINFIFHTNI